MLHVTKLDVKGITCTGSQLRSLNHKSVPYGVLFQADSYMFYNGSLYLVRKKPVIFGESLRADYVTWKAHRLEVIFKMTPNAFGNTTPCVTLSQKSRPFKLHLCSIFVA